MNTIVPYEPFWIVYLKGDKTIEISKQLYEAIKNDLATGKEFIVLGDYGIYNKFEIQKIERMIPSNEIEDYINKQEKRTRDLIKKYAKDNNIVWNSIEHVSNFLEANK